MRRLLLSIMVIIITGFSLHSVAPALAVSYPAGWNLISGPSGSTVQGAVGSLYTLQPGDVAYEALPTNATLTVGRGYWASFPSGGSLQAASDLTSFSLIVTAGQPVMVGNPSATNIAAVTGADRVLAYVGGGYVDGSALLPGLGAWVFGSGTVTITVTSVSPGQPAGVTAPLFPAAPQPAAQPAPAPQASATAAHLLQASGAGNDDTRDFSLSTTAAYVCVQVSGTSPSGAFGPDASFFFEQPNGGTGDASAEFTTSGCKTFHPFQAPATYYLHVIATPWTHWSVTVDAQ